MSTFIYSWNEHSEGAKALADELDIRRIKHQNSRFRGRANKTVINWGNGKALPEEIQKCRVLNNPLFVSNVSNKRDFFECMQQVIGEEQKAPRTPQFTTDEQTARDWIIAGKTVCIRSVLQGSGGEGLSIVGPENMNEFKRAPLYVEYIKKLDEYRIHIVNGEIIDEQRKAKRTDFEGERNTQIRNLANGYIFAREGFETPEDVKVQSKLAMAASGLDFGAVDVIWNRHLGQAFVLEINSAPGLMGTTLKNYAEAFRGMM